MHLRILLAVVVMLGTAHAGEIRIALNSDIRTTEPGGPGRDANADAVLGHIVEGLVAYREDFSIEPMLAESYQISADGKVYTFRLRRGLKFHNGADVTAADVKWNWDRLLQPRSKWSCKNLFNGAAVAGVKLLGVEAVSRDTVVFRLEKPSPLFLAGLASLQCQPAVLHRDSVATDGTWRSPIGTGPYKLSEWKKGESIVLSRFDGYVPSPNPSSGWAGRKQALEERVRWIVIPEHAAQKAALLAGQIDVMSNVDPEDLPFPQNRFATLIAPGLDWDALLLQTQDPLLRDVRMRKAIAAAIDFPALTKAVTKGQAQANPSPLGVSSSWHSTALSSRIPYDLKAAKRLLTEAGYRGQVLKLQTNKRYRTMHDNSVIVQFMLAKAGVAVQLEVLDWATQLANYQDGKFQLMLFGFSGKIDPSLDYAPLIGHKTKAAYYQWDDRSVDTLVQRIGTESARPARQALIDELHQRMIAQAPLLPIFNPPTIEVTARKVSGYKAWSVKTPRLWNVKLEQ